MARKKNVEVTAETVKSAVKSTAKAAGKVAAEATKTTAAKAAEKVAEVKESAAKKPAKRTATRKAAVKSEVFVQYWGKEINASDVVEAVKKLWTDELGKEASALKDIKVYIKPEDNGAHYVINGDITGFIEL